MPKRENVDPDSKNLNRHVYIIMIVFLEEV